MFGLIDPDHSDAATGRFVRAVGRTFAGRRFRGYGQWADVIEAGIGLTAGLVQLGVKVYQSDQERQRQQQAANACASYGSGYYYNPATGQCMPPQQRPGAAGAGGGFSIDPTTIAIGAGVVLLVLVATSGKGN